MAARVTAKKTAAKRPSPRPTPQVSDMPVAANGAPRVLRFSTTEEEAVEEREPLFYIDDREYTIPKVMPTNDALSCLHVFRTQGNLFATDHLLETLLGKEGYEALLSYKKLKPEDLQAIIEIATERMLGSAEPPKA